jgi:Outer membrane protein beta-barrel domain
MKKLSTGLLALLAMLGASLTAHAQVSFYGEFSADYLKGGPQTDVLYGGAGGVVFDGPKVLHDVLLFSGDIQVNSGYSSAGGGGYRTGEEYTALTFGPRVTLERTILKFAPYGQFNVGFARYDDNFSHSSTDNVYGVQVGATRKISPRLDFLADYSYSNYGYNIRQYTPQTFGVGVAFHLTKR